MGVSNPPQKSFYIRQHLPSYCSKFIHWYVLSLSTYKEKTKSLLSYLRKNYLPSPYLKREISWSLFFFFFKSTYCEVLNISSPGHILKDGYSSESNHDILCSVNPTIKSIDLAPHFLCPHSMNICMKAPHSDKNKYIQSLPWWNFFQSIFFTDIQLISNIVLISSV